MQHQGTGRSIWTKLIEKRRPEEQHVKDLGELFKVCLRHGLKLKLSKSEFFVRQVSYLGHVVSDEGIQPDPTKIEAITKIPDNLNTFDNVMHFLGLTGFYRRFIYRYANIAKPLVELSNATEWYWTEECTKAVQTLKRLMSEHPVLVYPNPAKEFVVTSDASEVCVGGVIEQEGRPCAYTSWTLHKYQLSWFITEKELYAIYSICKNYRHWLLGSKLSLVTHHKKRVSYNNMARESLAILAPVLSSGDTWKESFPLMIFISVKD